MTDNCFAIKIVHGANVNEHAEELETFYQPNRVITGTSDIQNGDLLLLEALPEAWHDASHRPWWCASNVLLLEGNRAPIVELITLEDALAALA